MINWSPGQTLDDVEKQVIEAALRYNNGNKTKTADSLNIAIRTLDNKLARYKQEAEEREAREKAKTHSQQPKEHV